MICMFTRSKSITVLFTLVCYNIVQRSVTMFLNCLQALITYVSITWLFVIAVSTPKGSQGCRGPWKRWTPAILLHNQKWRERKGTIKGEDPLNILSALTPMLFVGLFSNRPDVHVSQFITCICGRIKCCIPSVRAYDFLEIKNLYKLQMTGTTLNTSNWVGRF